MVAAGSVVELGDPLYTVDGTPVVALVGNLPAWRSLSTDSDDGPDIRQLESSLVQLGYDSDGEITIDDEFDAATETAVEHWQQGLGVEVTGEVALGAVAFVPASVTVGSVLVAVGDEIGEGDDVLTLDAETQQILATVPEEDQQLVAPGTSVDVDGELGTVTVLRSSTADGVVSVVAVIATAPPLAGATAGRAVSVDITTTDAIGVLMVPVEAVASRLTAPTPYRSSRADDRMGHRRETRVRPVPESGSGATAWPKEPRSSSRSDGDDQAGWN